MNLDQFRKQLNLEDDDNSAGQQVVLQFYGKCCMLVLDNYWQNVKDILAIINSQGNLEYVDEYMLSNKQMYFIYCQINKLDEFVSRKEYEYQFYTE